MSTLRTTNLQHPSAASPNMVLASDGKTTFGGAVVGTGLDLITPTGIAYSSGSATVSGGSITYTGVTSISLNGIFSATYDNYRIMLTSTLTSGAQNIYGRMRTAGTDNTTSNYEMITFFAAANSGTGVANAGTAAQMWYMSLIDVYESQMSIDISSPFKATNTMVSELVGGSRSGASGTAIYMGGFRHLSTTSFDGITFSVPASTMSGTIRVYGYRNS